MINDLKKGKADGIMAWHPDRLARNSIDGGLIIYLLDTGVIKDLKFATYTFENTPEGKMMLAYMFCNSKYFIDGLSKNVKRGNKRKLKEGWLPNMAPIGYLNCKETKTIIPDPERFKIIQELFRLMATGCYTPRMLYHKAKDEFGLRTVKRKRSGDRPVSLSSIYTMLKNPFYMGQILWHGKLYLGKHPAMITANEFDVVQTILSKTERKTRPKTPKRQFAYTGLMVCGECGCTITAEQKTKPCGRSYVYYHCTHRRMDYSCKQKSIKVEQLEQQFLNFLARIQISPSFYDLILIELNQENMNLEQFNQDKIKMIRTTLKKNETRLKNLIDMRLNDQLDDKDYENRRKQLQLEQLKLNEQIKTLENTDNGLELFKDCLELRKQAKKWFIKGNLEIKRLIIEITGSNFEILDRKLRIQAKKPFLEIPDLAGFPNLLALVEDVRKQGASCDVDVTFRRIKQLQKLVKNQN